MRKKIISFLIGLVCLSFWGARLHAEERRGFAIVIDSVSRIQAQDELSAYIRALESKQNFKVYTLIDRWGMPDSIRNELKRLHALPHEAIVGAVFIGDIPIPMIRDAQHLCSAFKMNQNSPWPESSVPSDRYYDDFSLQFRFLKRDSIAPYYYYSLSSEGSQQLHPDLFSGRIRPTDGQIPGSRYAKLRAYLKKATEAKLNPERITSVFVYTGSGSLSESKVAHIDEMASMHSHFPSLMHQPNAFRYMDYSDEKVIKPKLMDALMSPDLSVALMHHHGDFDTQYLSAWPEPSTTEEAREYLLHCYRTDLNTARRFKYDTDSVRRELQNRDGLSDAWMVELDDDHLNKEDSIEGAMTNLVLKDFADDQFRPNARVAFWDACYNGAWHRDDCIANEYIFQPGKTVCGLGGTVNVIQDKWPDRFAGLLEQGVMIGYLNQLCPDLEMHVIGDPTFAFRPEQENDLNNLICFGTQKDWERLFRESSHPDVQALALHQLQADGKVTDRQLLDILKTSPYDIVRTEAFLLLQSHRNEVSVAAIETACNDNFELLQRFAINALVKNGDPQLVHTLAEKLCDVNTSARVAFNALQGVQFFSREDLLPAMEAQLGKTKPYVVDAEAYAQNIMKKVENYAGRWDEDIAKLCRG
ncbi:MAG: HEAT repeat domain-containing protein [Paraprevotella sp.]|nr:HEAT repeat domain-containing protein [Paraprevotella sp.]